jgi:hypothetical protein
MIRTVYTDPRRCAIYTVCIPHMVSANASDNSLIHSAGNGIVFSMLCLYLCTAIMVMYQPGVLPSDIDELMLLNDSWNGRLNSALVANATITGVAGLMLTARTFSYIGDKLVDVVVSIVDEDSR